MPISLEIDTGRDVKCVERALIVTGPSEQCRVDAR